MAQKIVELSVLEAVLEERFADAEEMLEDFFPSELARFDEQLDSLSELVAKVKRGKSAR